MIGDITLEGDIDGFSNWVKRLQGHSRPR
jgi:hypothetical protein